MELVKDYRVFLKKLIKVLNRQNVSIGKAAGLRDDSRLLRSFEVKTNYTAITFLANDYFENVVRGRRPFGRKIPIERLLDWIRRYNISAKGMTTNQLAFAIQTNVYKYGIDGKHFDETIASNMLDITEDKMSKELERLVADEIESAFIK